MKLLAALLLVALLLIVWWLKLASDREARWIRVTWQEPEDGIQPFDPRLFQHDCDDCGRTDGTHNLAVEH